jgi:hypothetical protein
MALTNLIQGLQACVADAEWERAEVYFADLSQAVHELMSRAQDPRAAGALSQTLTSAQRAIEAHNAIMVSQALRHVAWLAGLLTRASPSSAA